MASPPTAPLQASMIRAVRCAVAAGAAAALAAACGGDPGGSDGPGGGSGGAADRLTGRGPITLVQFKDTSGNVQNNIDAWNRGHPNEKVRLIELPEEADAQRQQLVQNAEARSDAYTVLNLDVVWTSEFAANRWVVKLPAAQFDLKAFLPATVRTAQYRGRLYAAPWKTNAGLLFYRTDLLKKAGVAGPPKTWAEMTAACGKVKAVAPGIGCYGGQFEKYEGLTVNFSEIVHSAGGVVIDDRGRPNVNTPQARQGLDFLVRGFQSGLIPKEALTYKEEEARRAFEKGGLVFLRQWPYQWALSNQRGSSKVAGKFDVAPLPGLAGPGAPTLGGFNLAISSFARNKATALDFIKFLIDPQRQRTNMLTTAEPPSLAALYTDPALRKKAPYLPVLDASLRQARPRPEAVRYGEVTKAIQENAYAALTGSRSVDQALSGMQSTLGPLAQR